MNERIKTLIKESGGHNIAYEGRPGSYSYAFTDDSVEKFAELIVQECVKEIEFQYGGGSDQPMDNEWDRAIECVSSMVKYRFGVEE